MGNGLQQRAGRAVGNGRREDRVSLGQGTGRSEEQSEWPVEQMSQGMVCLTSPLLRRHVTPPNAPLPRIIKGTALNILVPTSVYFAS